MNRECDVPHMAGARPARLGVRGLRQSSVQPGAVVTNPDCVLESAPVRAVEPELLPLHSLL